MRGGLWIAIGVVAGYLSGYGYGRWYATGKIEPVQAKGNQEILGYRCPMHPQIRSDKPGDSPCCNMRMQPVYAQDPQEPPKEKATTVRVTAAQRQLAGVRVEKVAYEAVAKVVRGVARVAANENKAVRVQTKLDGWIDQIQVTAVGAPVKRGQTLLTVYSPKSQVAQQEYLAAMDASGLDMNSSEYIQAKALNKLVPGEGALTAARLQLQQLGFTDAQIETIGKAHRTMARLPLVAPTSGTVIEYNVQPRQKVNGETLYTIANLSEVWVFGDFFDVDASRIRTGQTARLSVPLLPGREFWGKVDTVLPAVDRVTRSLKVRFDFANAGELLRPEMFGEVAISLGDGRKKLTVPADAVVDSGRTQRVWVDEGDGSLAVREVRIGERLGDRVEIRQGLKAGEQVVVSGNFLLDAESRMRVGGETGAPRP